jgi:predicted ATPase
MHESSRVAKVIGRERELALAEGFLGSAGKQFGVLVLDGEPGIGKTTLWREVIRRAEERGSFILSCRPAQTEAKLSLSAVADLLEPVPENAFDVLPTPQRQALDVALLRATPEGAVTDRRTLAIALRSVLRQLASEAPVLVAIDDLQWLDAASAATLEFALRRLRAERIGFLASRRLPEASALNVDELAAPDVVRRAKIGPLSLAGLHHLLKERVELPPSRSLLVRIHSASDGNPLFALEIGRLLEEVGIPAVGEPLPVPSNVQELVKRRVARLPTPTREALLAAAALDTPRERTVSLALGRSIGADLEPAEVHGVTTLDGGAISFSHPLFAAAISPLQQPESGAVPTADSHTRSKSPSNARAILRSRLRDPTKESRRSWRRPRKEPGAAGLPRPLRSCPSSPAS